MRSVPNIPSKIALKGSSSLLLMPTLLWEKQPNGSALEVRIAETVTIVNGRPRQWYFTASDGTVRRKFQVHKDTLLSEWGSKSGIVAVWLVNKIHSDSEILTEYLDSAGLKRLLDSPPSDGLLQRFLEGTGFMAHWSEKFIVLKRLVCKSVDCFESGYEEEVNSGLLPGKISQIALRIREHIELVSDSEIKPSSLRLVLKKDKYEGIWLILCSLDELRLQTNTTFLLCQRCHKSVRNVFDAMKGNKKICEDCFLDINLNKSACPIQLRADPLNPQSIASRRESTLKLIAQAKAGDQENQAKQSKMTIVDFIHKNAPKQLRQFTEKRMTPKLNQPRLNIAGILALYSDNI